MAVRSYNYRPYHSRRRKKKSKKVLFLLLLLIIIIIIIVSVNSCEKDDSIVIEETKQPAATAPVQKRSVIDIPKTPKKTVTVAETKPKSEPKPEVKVQPEKLTIPAQPVLESQDQATIEKLKQIQAQAQQFLNNKQIIAARDLLNDTLKLPLTAKQRNELKRALANLSEKWLFSDVVWPDDRLCTYHTVLRNQYPSTLGNKYNVPWQFILKINGIAKPEHLREGKVKVVNGPFTAKIYRSTFTMDVFLQGVYVKSYKVGLGKLGPDGNPTPTGLWRLKGRGTSKLIRPPWPEPVSGRYVYYEDPDYPLGERWIGLDGIDDQAKGKKGFGIHGTNQPDSIGKFASDGCIRMHNEDVIEFYDMVTEGLTEVQVVD